MSKDIKIDPKVFEDNRELIEDVAEIVLNYIYKRISSTIQLHQNALDGYLISLGRVRNS